jgi:hypothetical protein
MCGADRIAYQETPSGLPDPDSMIQDLIGGAVLGDRPTCICRLLRRLT